MISRDFTMGFIIKNCTLTTMNPTSQASLGVDLPVIRFWDLFSRLAVSGNWIYNKEDRLYT